MFKKEFVWALIVACLVSILVWWNISGTPGYNERLEDRGMPSAVTIIARSFVVSFIVAFVVSYFTLSDMSGSDEVLKYIHRGKPDF